MAREAAPDASDGRAGRHAERADFRKLRRVDPQRAAADDAPLVHGDRELADALEDVLAAARQVLALAGPVRNDRADGVEVLDARFADRQLRVRCALAPREPEPAPLDALGHPSGCGASRHIALGERGVQGQRDEHVGADARVDLRHALDAESLERRAVADRLPHETAHIVVRIAEGHALGDEVVRELGRVGVAAERSLARAFASHRHAVEHDGQHAQGQRQVVHRIKERLLVLLKVLVVGKRKPLEHRQQRHERAHDPARLAADQLERIGVLLLRHEARPARHRI